MSVEMSFKRTVLTVMYILVLIYPISCKYSLSDTLSDPKSHVIDAHMTIDKMFLAVCSFEDRTTLIYKDAGHGKFIVHQKLTGEENDYSVYITDDHKYLIVGKWTGKADIFIFN